MYASLWCLSEMEARNSEALATLIGKGTQIRTFPAEVLQRLRLLTGEVIAEITEKDPFSRRVYESYNAFRKKAGQYSEITEKVFYNQIQLS